MEPDHGAAGRYEVVVEEDVPRGDLYELEQTTCYRVVDRQSNRVVLVFEGRMEASLSHDDGLWGEPHVSGVRRLTVAPDERSVRVEYHDGREEWVPLPE